jgi:hypothetical protein
VMPFKDLSQALGAMLPCESTHAEPHMTNKLNNDDTPTKKDL